MRRRVPQIKDLEHLVSGISPPDRHSLVSTYIKQDEELPTPAEAYALPTGTHVWAIVGHMLVSGDDVDKAACYYDLNPQAVCAAVIYAVEHPHAIAQRLVANASYWTSPELDSTRS